MDCIICGSKDVMEDGGYYDDRYGYPGIFFLTACRNCGHRSLNGSFGPQQLVRLYTDYYPRSSMTLAQYRPRKESTGFSAWLNGDRRSAYTWVPRNVQILDIGCGFGETLGYHRNRGCDVYGVEADENIRRVADKFGFKVHVGLFDPALYEPGSFDFVTMDQVMEHVADPVATLRGIATVLKPGGTAIISTPNAGGWGARAFGRRWINWHVPYHQQFFTRKSMAVGAEYAGLHLERSTTITCSEWLLYQWIHLVTCPQQGQPSGFWSSKGAFSTFQRRVVRFARLVHRTRIDHWITRFFDGFGVGDNFLFILMKR